MSVIGTSGTSATFTIVDPRATTKVSALPASPPIGDLNGKLIGLRRDEFWQSWDWVTDEWAQALEASGAKVLIWRAPVKKGEQAAAGALGFRQFLETIDAGIFGLCNCGSCTMWAVHDTVHSLNSRMPTLITATRQFEKLARALASKSGHTDLRMVVLPYPLEGLPESEVRDIANQHYAEMLQVFGATTP